MAGLKQIPLTFALLLSLLLATAACTATGSGKGSLPSPSAKAATASASKASPATLEPLETKLKSSPVPSSSQGSVVYTAGDRPFAHMHAEGISRIRVIVYSAAQPPYFPHPFKDAKTLKDLNALVSILNGIQVQKKSQLSDMPVGATRYSLIVNGKDGTLMSVYLYGGDILSEAGATYQIAKLPDIGKMYQALVGQTRLLPGNADTLEQENGCLFQMDGWSYYFEPYQGSSGCLARENGSGKTQIVSKEVDVIHPAVFPGESRIVFIKDTDPDSRNENDIIVSIKPDGSDRKTLAAGHGIADTQIWDGNSLYYVGWTRDMNYPRPLLCVDENLAENKKAMDIPGPLLAVKNGNVYCLSADAKSIVQLPSGTVNSTFSSAIENTQYMQGKWVLYDRSGGIFFWTPEDGAVPAPKRQQ